MEGASVLWKDNAVLVCLLMDQELVVTIESCVMVCPGVTGRSKTASLAG